MNATQELVDAMDVGSSEGGAIYSRMGDDPDICDLVELFVLEMPNRIKALLGQLNARDWEGARRVAHQLKGAASSYGFDSVSRIAGKLEQAILKNEPEQVVRDIIEEVIVTCGRMRSGRPAQ